MAGYESTPTRRGTMKKKEPGYAKKTPGTKKTAMSSKGKKRVATKKMNYGY